MPHASLSNLQSNHGSGVKWYVFIKHQCNDLTSNAKESHDLIGQIRKVHLSPIFFSPSNFFEHGVSA